jgi:hypothetical protein
MRYRARTDFGRRIAERVGRRGVILLILCVGDIGIGLSFLTPTPELAASQSFVWRSQWMPSYAWGWLWIAVGVTCGVCAFFRHDTLGWSSAVGLKLLWAMMELTGWLAGAIALGFRPALIWTIFAALVLAVAGFTERPSGPYPPAKGARS